MRVFVLYTKKSPSDKALKAELLVYLSPLNLEIVDPFDVELGTYKMEDIQGEIRHNDIALVFLSPKLLIDEDLFKQIELIHLAGEAILVPILVKPCLWENTSLKNLPILPKDDFPLASNKDQGIPQVATALKSLISKIESQEIDYPELLNHLPLPDYPYPGLNPFKEKDAPIFFGRSKELKELGKMIQEKKTHVILFFGTSGVGKSSILHAGIKPRWKADWGEQVYYLQRNRTSGAHNIFSETPKLHGKEKKLVIIDQLEEIFTNPNKEESQEMSKFSLSLKKYTDQHPEAIVLLSFRKEYLPEIKENLKDCNINFQEYFLKSLDKKGVFEAIKGVVQIERLAEEYRLAFEEKVIEAIITDVFNDKESHRTPLLQILLGMMWIRVKDKNERKIGYQLYNRLPKNLEDFLNKQLNLFSNKFHDQTQKGLIFDILDFFITDMGTTEEHSFENLSKNYPNVPKIFEIKEALIEHHLLSDSKKEGLIRLTHDSLAPLIKNLIQSSGYPVQIANRYLDLAILSRGNLTNEGFKAVTEIIPYRRKLNETELEKYHEADNRNLKFKLTRFISEAKEEKVIPPLLEYFFKKRMFKQYTKVLTLEAKGLFSRKLRREALINYPTSSINQNKLSKSLLRIVNSLPDSLQSNAYISPIEIYLNEGLENALEYSQKTLAQGNDFEELEVISSDLYKVKSHEINHEIGLISFSEYFDFESRFSRQFINTISTHEHKLFQNFMGKEMAYFPKWFEKSCELLRKGELANLLAKFIAFTGFMKKEESELELRNLLWEYELEEENFLKGIEPSNNIVESFGKNTNKLFNLIERITINSIDENWEEWENSKDQSNSSQKESTNDPLHDTFWEIREKYWKTGVVEPFFKFAWTTNYHKSIFNIHPIQKAYILLKYNDIQLRESKGLVSYINYNHIILKLEQLFKSYCFFPYKYSEELEEKYDDLLISALITKIEKGVTIEKLIDYLINLDEKSDSSFGKNTIQQLLELQAKYDRIVEKESRFLTFDGQLYGNFNRDMSYVDVRFDRDLKLSKLINEFLSLDILHGGIENSELFYSKDLYLLSRIESRIKNYE